MSESEKPQPYLSADFGEQGGRLEWMTHQEIMTWIAEMQSQWNWIGQQGQNSTNIAWNQISKTFNNIITALQQVQNYRNQGQEQNALDHIASARTTLEGFIRGNPWLLPNIARRRYVEEIRDSGNSLEAALIVSHWMGLDLGGAPIRSVVNALLQWELYERGIKDRMKTESATLKRLAGDMQTTLTQYQESERTQTTRFDELYGQLSVQSGQQQNSFDSGQQARDEAWKNQLNDTQKELDLLKETYDKHMSIAAPVDYWETKRKKHGRWSIYSFLAIVVGMVAAAYLLHSELRTVGRAVMESKVMESAAVTQPLSSTAIQNLANTATAWHLGSFILMATLAFWFIRLLVRIFLSSLHLENDAAERVTMAKTYLALLRKGDLPQGDSINTVLAALFRPSGDGIVKDEGVPPSTLELFTKLGK